MTAIQDAICLLIENGYVVLKAPALDAKAALPAPTVSAAPRDILRRQEVERRTGLSCSALYAMMQRREFPRPVKLTSKTVGWPAEVVDAWLQSRQQAHDPERAPLPTDWRKDGATGAERDAALSRFDARIEEAGRVFLGDQRKGIGLSVPSTSGSERSGP